MTYSLTWCCSGWRNGLDVSPSGVVDSEAEERYWGVFDRVFGGLKSPGEDMGVLGAVRGGCIEGGRREGDRGREERSVWRRRSFGCRESMSNGLGGITAW